MYMTHWGGGRFLFPGGRFLLCVVQEGGFYCVVQILPGWARQSLQMFLKRYIQGLHDGEGTGAY